jgi:hypothetical protein
MMLDHLYGGVDEPELKIIDTVEVRAGHLTNYLEPNELRSRRK